MLTKSNTLWKLCLIHCVCCARCQRHIWVDLRLCACQFLLLCVSPILPQPHIIWGPYFFFVLLGGLDNGGGAGGGLKGTLVQLCATVIFAATEPLSSGTSLLCSPMTTTGIVLKWFAKRNRGFGYIQADDGSSDVFCDARDLVNCLQLSEGDAVEFDVQLHVGQRRANNVRKLPRRRKRIFCARHYGVVAAWLEGRNFGFIEPDFGGDNVMVHADAVNDGECLVEGDVVTFEVRQACLCPGPACSCPCPCPC